MASSNEVFINPVGLDSDTSAFDSTTSGISNIKANGVLEVKKKTILDSMDTMIFIIETFNQCVEEYVALSNKDVEEIKSMKEQWVMTDTKIASDIEGK
ncbi:hypothetical protein [Oceanobacillus bengalensis]|uniref:Uncharacterized protein n=1 Tax=Oceanobacillus bengalensis TaxID=1435466 RepID=A0A494Z2Y1_9BACI|nr:hypothetical protein [Oceanobacillus bengalensis]RKQ16843.1 hypothetical protein D8M05_06205 [Oceanobacillus bengalensis]